MTSRTLALVLVTAAGCKSAKQEPAAETKPPPTAVAVQPAAGSGEDLTEKMRHCPVTLPGVTTEIEDIDGGLRFVLHASSPDLVSEARKRANRLVAFTAGRSKEKHGGGRGGGFMRNCPIVTPRRRSPPKRSKAACASW